MCMGVVLEWWRGKLKKQGMVKVEIHVLTLAPVLCILSQLRFYRPREM